MREALELLLVLINVFTFIFGTIVGIIITYLWLKFAYVFCYAIYILIFNPKNPRDAG